VSVSAFIKASTPAAVGAGRDDVDVALRNILAMLAPVLQVSASHKPATCTFESFMWLGTFLAARHAAVLQSHYDDTGAAITEYCIVVIRNISGAIISLSQLWVLDHAGVREADSDCSVLSLQRIVQYGINLTESVMWPTVDLIMQRINEQLYQRPQIMEALPECVRECVVALGYSLRLLTLSENDTKTVFVGINSAMESNSPSVWAVIVTATQRLFENVIQVVARYLVVWKSVADFAAPLVKLQSEILRFVDSLLVHPLTLFPL
jgi:hypothetical protein